MMAAKKRKTRAPSSCPSDFSAPWKFSDVVLIVEDQRFHVHRSTLAFWSPVFEKMFTTGLKEKTSDEIPLPEKKASEFKELLLMIYPSLEEKVVNKRNCYFLFELAHEYQVESIAQKCEALMVSMVKNRTEDNVLAMLIYEARRLKLKELKEHRMRDQIEADNYLEIVEGIIQRLEEKCTIVKNNSLAILYDVSSSLYSHCREKRTMKSYRYDDRTQTTGSCLSRVTANDVSKTNTRCDSLVSTANHLQELEAAIMSL